MITSIVVLIIVIVLIGVPIILIIEACLTPRQPAPTDNDIAGEFVRILRKLAYEKPTEFSAQFGQIAYTTDGRVSMGNIAIRATIESQALFETLCKLLEGKFEVTPGTRNSLYIKVPLKG